MELLKPLEIANKNLVTIDIGESIANAHALMQHHHIRHLVVLRDGQGIGVLSDRDLMKALRVEVKDFYSVRVREQSFKDEIFIGDIMSWPIQCIDQGAPLGLVIDEMINSKISCVLVTHAKKSIVGIITTEDLLLLLKRSLNEKHSDYLGENVLSKLYTSPLNYVMELLSSTGI